MATPKEAALDAPTFSRRRFALGVAGALTAPVLAACGSAAPPTPKVEPTHPPPAAVPTQPPTATPRPPRSSAMTTPDFSVHVFLWGAFETTKRDLGLVSEMGFGWVKQRFEWRYIEPHVKGKYDWGEPDRIVEAIDKADLKVIARIDNQPKWTRNDDSWPTPGPPEKLSDWGDFMGAMAERY
ncbi:MAG TPA: beta-galactosidase [Chloroflexota bacterium]|jgi:hypothetical protein